MGQGRHSHGGVDSLAPIQTRRLSVHEQAKMLQRPGYGQLLTLMAVALLAAVAGLVWLEDVDGRQQLDRAAAQLEGLSRAHLDGFAACALPDVARSRLQSEAGMVLSMQQLGDRFGKRYGQQLETCLPKLQDYEQGVRGVALPGEHPELTHLHATAAELCASWREYAGYLRDPDLLFHRSSAKKHVQRVAAAWVEHAAARQAMRRALSSHLL